MRVLLAPDSFGGTLSASEAATAMGAAFPGADLAPLSDGGPGFLEVLPGVRREMTVTGPLGRPVRAAWLCDGSSAYVEAAQACGLHLSADRDPEAATSRGVGELCAAAVAAGARTLVVGIGGTASIDGGRGLLEAFCLTTPHGAGRDSRRGAAVSRQSSLVDLVVATDVENPLLGPDGAAAVFGPQKGADAAAIARLEARLARQAAGRPEASLPGAGAAGGLGFALLSLGARRVSGAALVGERLRLPARVAAADLVVTGEGAYDATSLRGKVVAYVAGLARDAGVPCVVLAGRVEVGRRQAAAHGVVEAWDLTSYAGPAALSAPAESVTALARRVAAQWGAG